METQLPKSIIISRTDNLGDVMLTLPMTGYIKAVSPKTQVFFLGKSYTRSVIEASEFVDKFIDKAAVLQGSEKLSDFGAEAIIFAGPDKEVAKLAKVAKIPLRIGTSHRWYHWLYCNKRVNFTRKQSPLHESQLNFNLFEPFGGLTNPTLEQIQDWYGMNLPKDKVMQWISSEKFNLIVHPKSKGSAKEWGLANYADLIKSLPKEDFQVLITGVKEEGELIKSQMPEIFQAPHVKDVTGKLQLTELIQLIDQADGFLAGSTGPLHIASALGKYTLGIYPVIRPMHPGRWKPVGKNAHHLVFDKSHCNDCRKTDECNCVKAIKVAQVKAKLIEFVKHKDVS